MPCFASGQSFLDPQLSEDGTPYGPKRYRSLAKECWYISDQTHTSYTDVLDLAYIDRVYLMQFINEKQTATQAKIDEMKAEALAARANRR